MAAADTASRAALVCGASRGIGRAIAAALAADGYRVTALARSQGPLEQLVEDLGGEAAGHAALAVDLTDREALTRAVDELLERQGTVHALINNLSGPKAGLLIDAAPGAFAEAVETHVGTAHLLVRRLLPGMQAAGFGRVVNVISTSVRMPIPNLGVSNTTRGAMAAWAKTLAAEVAAGGVTVNSVLPGYTATERLDELMAAAASRTGKTTDTVAAEWRAKVPMGRFGLPEEVANVAAFLCSDKASYVTGEAIRVDGGRTGSV